MAIYRRSNSKYWWMSFQHGGNHVQRSTKCTNKRDAEVYERAYRTQLAKGEVGFEEKIDAPRFTDAMTGFLQWVRVEHNAKPNTVRSYECAAKPLISFFGQTKIDRITSGDVEKFKQWRSSQPRKPRTAAKRKSTSKQMKTVAPATVNRGLAVLKIFFNHCIKSGFVVVNPVRDVKLLRETPPPFRVLTDDEERLYLIAASQPLQDISVILVDTGMRPEEVFRLDKTRLEFEKGCIFNPHGKSSYSRRFVPMTTRVQRILTKLVAESDSDQLFLNPKTGKPITTLKTAHKTALKRSGVKRFRIYDLKHTFATRFVQSGGDLMTLKELLGHSDLKMVARYAHPTQEHKFDAIRKMEAGRSTDSKKVLGMTA